MSVDVRINAGIWNHPKWLRLKARCGQEGQLALIRLWCWAGEYRDEGRLHGVSDAEIESVAAGWVGEPGQLLAALLELRWAERDAAGVVSLHDWQEHNPFRASRSARVRAARRAAVVKACRRRGEELPAETERELSEASLVRYYGAKVGRHKYQQHHGVVLTGAPRTHDEGALRTPGGCTPSPTPSPSPTPTPTPMEGGEGTVGAAPSGSSAARPAGASPPGGGGGAASCARCGQRATVGPSHRGTHRPEGLEEDLCPGHLTEWFRERLAADRTLRPTSPGPRTSFDPQPSKESRT